MAIFFIIVNNNIQTFEFKLQSKGAKRLSLINIYYIFDKREMPFLDVRRVRTPPTTLNQFPHSKSIYIYQIKQ